jgi:hypothetical protein
MRSAVASSQESMDSPGTGTTRRGSLRAVTAALRQTNLTSRGWTLGGSGPDQRLRGQKVRTAVAADDTACLAVLSPIGSVDSVQRVFDIDVDFFVEPTVYDAEGDDERPDPPSTRCGRPLRR